MTNWRMAGVAAVSLLAMARTASTSQQSRRRLSGDLTKPVAQYTGDEFSTLVRGLGFGPVVHRDRRCRGNPECTGARLTRLSLDAVADADSLAAGNLPQYGVVAARVLNVGADTEDRYGMQAGGRYAYFLIVFPGASGSQARWLLEELTVQGKGRTHRTVSTGVVTFCNHPYVRGARADFKTCAQGIPVKKFSPVALMQGSESPLWFGCASGCCTAD